MTTETDIQGAPADDRIDAAHGYVRAFARAPSASRGFRERTGASSLVSVGADGRAPYLHRHNLAHALAGFTAAEAPPALAGAQTSGRADKAHRGMDRVDLDEAEDAHGGLVIAGGDAAKPLEHACHALDAVALGVSNPIQRARLLAVGFSRDDRMRALKARLSPQLIAGQPLSASPSCGCCPTATNRVAEMEQAERDRQARVRGYVPCWEDEQGNREFIYNVTITNNQWRVSAGWPEDRRSDIRANPILQLPDDQSMTFEQWKSFANPIFEYGRAQPSNCRFIVRLFDRTTTKAAYQRGLRWVGRYFIYDVQ
jgi:hypothetical protein